jgi:polar amino acid transport system substrate-binding protein
LGTTGSFWVSEELVDTGRIIAANANEYDTIIAAVLVVQNGQKDAVVLDTPVAYKYANDTAFNLKVGFVIPTNEQYGIAIQKGQSALVVEINKAINAMKADGTLQEIINKWA